MSAYSCVLPVDWDRLWDGVIAAWLDVLAGRMTVRDFYVTQIPLGDGLVEELLRLEAFPAVPEYAEAFPDSGRRAWDATPIRKSAADEVLAERMDLTLVGDLVGAAIKQTCSVELPGEDRFARTPYDGYYSRLFGKPHVQVAGTKNRFYFLEAVFTFELESSECVYRVARMPGSPSAGLELLEALFLGVRALPGTWIAPVVPSWPAFDEPCFLGYLAPAEVVGLARVIPGFHAAAEEQDDQLFPLLVDRVQRAATAGLGLLTIHEGL